MNDRLLSLSLFFVVCASACATTPGEPVDASGSAMLGLAEKPKHPVWEDWAPDPSVSMDNDVLAPMQAFDYWQLNHSDYVEASWAAVSTLIDSVRRQSGDQSVRDAATLMLEALEPGEASDVLVDATFYVTEAREGVALRFLRELEGGGSASFVLMLDRSAGDAPEPDRIRMFAAPGFAEPEGFEVAMRRGSNAWAAKTRASTEDAGRATIDEADLYASVLISQVWRPLTGNAYASATMRRAEVVELPSPFRAALGLEVGDRAIDRVFTNSVFTPRMDDFAPGS
jgi:hypothetical protein